MEITKLYLARCRFEAVTGFWAASLFSTLIGILYLHLILLASVLVSCENRHQPPRINRTTEKVVDQDKGRSIHQIKLIPYWVPSAQFAGYYVGIEKGIFKKHGINLELLPFDPLMPVASLLTDKKTDFCLLWLVNALELRNKGVDIVNIAQLSSRSSLMLITKKNSGISKIGDMDGKRAGIWIGYEKQPQALFRKYKLDVEIVPIGSTNNLFLQGGVDILNANWFNEYHSVLNSGVEEEELNTFFFADYGLNFLEDGIYCLADKVKEDPGLCSDFVTATLESWNYAFDNQEEAIDIVIKYAKAQNQPMNRSHQRWILSHYKTMYIPEGSKAINTCLMQKDFESVQQIMLENRFIKNLTPFDKFYKPVTNCQEPENNRSN